MAKATYYLSMMPDADDSDPECAHSMADELLGKALVSAANGQITPAEARKILAAYKRVPKWFA